MQAEYALYGPKKKTSSAPKPFSAVNSKKIGKKMTNYSVDQAFGIFASNRLDQSDPSLISNSKALGCIAYVRRTDKFQPRKVFSFNNKGGGVEYRNNVSYIEPGVHDGKFAFYATPVRDPVMTGREIRAFTAIGGAGLKIKAEDVKISNVEIGGTIAEVSSIYISPQGAQVCKRYVDGKLTNEPLWPWPMNQRILDATKQAGREPVDVTATIEELFGEIPRECGSGG